MKKYLVGGAVRDSILQLEIKERDWVVTGATPKDMIKKGYQQVGKDFPVFLHPKSREEYALARIEKKSYKKGHNGFDCYTSPKVTLSEDLRRRDLTINAIAKDINGNLIDPYKGQKDLSNRWLRHVSESFVEDPLRVLRVARFAARFAYLNFRIAPETIALMIKMSHELYFLSPERIWKETEKALNTFHPHIYFTVLHSCGALNILFPEIDPFFSLYLEKKYIKKNNMNIVTTLSAAAMISNDISVRFATLCGYISSNSINKKLNNKHNNYNLKGVKIIEKLCKRLRVPNLLRNLAIIVAKYYNVFFLV